MAEQALLRQLYAGIRAAQQGEKAKARELIEAVLKRDRNNEQAWIWLAAVVDTAKERRVCLERVVKINPKNRVAQEAINKMVGVLSTGGGEQKIDYFAISKAAETPLPESLGGGGSASQVRRRISPRAFLPYLVTLASILGGLLAASFVVPAIFPELFPTATFTRTPTLPPPTATVDEFITPPSPTIPPSPTFSGTLITREANLPPTHTPTITLTPTDTPTVMPTLPGLTNYNWLLLATQGTSLPALYRVNGNGSGLQPFLANLADFDYSLDSGIVVFTEQVDVGSVAPTVDPNITPTGPIVPAQTGMITRMFFAQLSSIGQRTEISLTANSNVIAPSLSPDGQRIAFASDADGDYEIYIYDIATGDIRQVTNNTGVRDLDPDWSPTGSNLVYATERATDGFLNLFNIDLTDASGETNAIRITSNSGNNTNPAWSPTTNLIAFLNVDDGGTQVLVTDTENSFLRELTFSPNDFHAEPSWTSDGLFIVYAAGPINGDHPIYTVPSQGGASNRLNLNGLSIMRVVQR